MTDRMTSAERTAMLRMIARQAKVADHDVQALAAKRYADFERRATEIYDAQKLGVEDLVSKINAEVDPLLEEMRGRVRQYCAEHNIPKELQPDVVPGHALITSRAMSYYQPGRLAELRRKAKAEIDEQLKQARTEIERQRANIEAKVFASSFQSREALTLIGDLPTAESLLPPLDVLELEQRARGDLA